MPARGITLCGMANAAAATPTPPRVVTSLGVAAADPAARGAMGIIGTPSAGGVGWVMGAGVGVDPSPCTAELESPLGTDPGQVGGTDTAPTPWA